MEKWSWKNLIKNVANYVAQIKKSKLCILYLVYVLYCLTASPHAVYEIHSFYKELSRRPNYQQENFESLLEDWAKLKTSGGYREVRNYHKRYYCGPNGTGGQEAWLDNVFNTISIKTPTASELSYGYVTTPSPYDNAYTSFSIVLYLPHLVTGIITLALIIVIVFSFSEQTKWTRWTIHALLFISFLLILRVFQIVEDAHFLRALELMIVVEKNDQSLEVLAFELGLIYTDVSEHLAWLYADNSYL